jgi:hypothetical protein
MDRELQIWLVVFVGVAAASLLAQLAIWVALYCGVRRLLAKVQKLGGHSDPAGSALQQYGATAHELADSLKRSLNNVAEVSERLKYVATEIAESSQKHLQRIDRMLDDLVPPAQKQNPDIDMGVPKPLREIQMLATGLRWALGIFLDRRTTAAQRQHASAPAAARDDRG